MLFAWWWLFCYGINVLNMHTWRNIENLKQPSAFTYNRRSKNRSITEALVQNIDKPYLMENHISGTSQLIDKQPHFAQVPPNSSPTG